MTGCSGRTSALVVREFEDPAVAPDVWDKLLTRDQRGTVFSTWAFQRAWWSVHGRGQLLLTVALDGGEPRFVAPLYADGGMIFLVGSGSCDYLDFVGGAMDARLAATALAAAREAAPDFVGFRFYHVPDASTTASTLRRAGEHLGLHAYDEGSLIAPSLSMADHPGLAETAARKQSLVRHERRLRRDGELEVDQLVGATAILPELPAFFAQHIERWSRTGSPSLFTAERERRFYQALAGLADAVNWVRFTRVRWNGRPIAYHFGFCHAGSYLWYKPSFAIDLARFSPGEVLLRHLLLAAIREGAHTFDFGLGEEAFKWRFANGARRVTTWGLYPPSKGRESG